MRIFAGTAEYYQTYRPGIPAAVVDVLTSVAVTTRPRHLLDIGTGTGMVVAAMLPHFDDVIAIDTDADMLAMAEASLRPLVPAGTRLTLESCAAEKFVPPAGWQADLVTICRAFHWLDQQLVLDRLAGQVATDGVVAIFGDGSVWSSDSPWAQAVRSVVQEFLGEQRRAGEGVFRPSTRPYREILADSAFSQVSEVRVPVTRDWFPDTILGYLYSTSFAAPRLFGTRRPEFESAIREKLAALNPDGIFREDASFTMTIGRRGEGPSGAH